MDRSLFLCKERGVLSRECHKWGITNLRELFFQIFTMLVSAYLSLSMCHFYSKHHAHKLPHTYTHWLVNPQHLITWNICSITWSQATTESDSSQLYTSPPYDHSHHLPCLETPTVLTLLFCPLCFPNNNSWLV